jgi:gas vesicle protein
MAYEYDRFDDESSGGGAFVMGLIAGAVLGAGIGMLLAPKAGSELRSQLGDQASRLRERAADGYTAASRKVSDASTRVTEM